MKLSLLLVTFALFGCASVKSTPDLITNDELQCRKSVSKIALTNNLQPFDSRALMDLCHPWAANRA